jgi:hypothetical protein
MKLTNDFEDMEASAAMYRRGVELEAEAVSLIKQYGFFLPAPAKGFFRKLAIYLNWQKLIKEL